MFRRSAADVVRFAGEKGSCDLFPTLVQTRSTGAGLFRGKLVFVGTAGAVRTKTQLAQYKTKNRGYTARGKKVGFGGIFRILVRGWPIDKTRFNRSYIHIYSYRYRCIYG